MFPCRCLYGVQLEPRDDHPRFGADLHMFGGEEVPTRGKLRLVGDVYSVVFDIPASALFTNRYELALKGVRDDQSVHDIGYDYFSVQKP